MCYCDDAQYNSRMSVLLETTAGDIVVDLKYKQYEIESYNFLKLCQCNFYQNQCFYNLQKGQSVQFGNPLLGYEDRKELRLKNTSVEGIVSEPVKSRLLKATESLKQSGRVLKGSLGSVVIRKQETGQSLIGSQVVLSLAEHDLDATNIIYFGDVIHESWYTLDEIERFAVDNTLRPIEDIRVRSTFIIYDPFHDERNFPKYEVTLPMQDVRLPQALVDEFINEDPEVRKDIKRKELSLEIIEDIPIMGIKPSPRVLFICKLNPLTRAKDLVVIFQRFGAIVSVEIVRDKSTGHSLGYGFIEFTDKKSCENAYKKMEGVIIDDRRIHVDFSQSVKAAVKAIDR
ncbi:hypothetical protein ZYGR_0I07930 [Zygosaccharomyces rouxii]|uniref:Peptidyl-prolyl cis-trans isomerase n=1 Tax=Zygosaccharomyces rouxii TaxID=4956 RepID=A0A1Q2ZYG2_ZYGRO|nr:hypothetical protein ZYGR_0I07930 [Zygosaccharomyces rouxii]